MSDGETKLADSPGKFVQIVTDGHRLNDFEWTNGRILLSNKRLVLASNEGKRTIPLSKIATVKSRRDVNEALAKVSRYLSVQIGNNVILVSPADEDFDQQLYTALLDQRVVLVKHPAVKGGVVQSVDWKKARIKISEDTVDLAIATGEFVEIELADVGTVEGTEKTVRDKQRRVLEIEHTIDGTSVETYLSGTTRDSAILGSYVRQGTNHETDVDLDQHEQEVLMALYTGVSPFEIPDFVGMDVEEVETVFDRLVESGILREVRTRREVSLKPRGRNIASEEMSQQ